MLLFRRLCSSAAHPARFQLPPTIRQLLSSNVQADTPATVTGWIKSIRKQKNVSFAVISDGTTAEGLQAVLAKQQSGDLLRRLVNGATVRLTGKLVRSPGSGQDWELIVHPGDGGTIQVLGDCDINTYPIQKKLLSTEYLRDNAYLRARTRQTAAMLRLRDNISRRISQVFETQGFIYTHTPIITANDAEGAGETFRIAPLPSSPDTPPLEFFSRPAYLTVSHQLHLESLSAAISRVYTLSPCFRAERSMTGRHLSEFWMLEAEWNLAMQFNNVEEICTFVEGLIRSSVSLRSPDVVKLWNERDGGLESNEYRALRAAIESDEPWRRMTYTKALEALETEYTNGSKKFEFKPVWGESLSSEHERWLAEVFVGGPVFVTDYPIGLKPFYMRVNDDNKTVACFDLLVPRVGELVGGSVREERWGVLTRRMKECGLLPLESETAAAAQGSEESSTEIPVGDPMYKWYADLRKYGGAPHGGFGLGFERLIGWVGGIDNVRECIGMPRWAGRMIM